MRLAARELRAKILELTAAQSRELGIGKSTLHYLREKAKNNSSFKTYLKVKRKLEAATSSLETGT
jgi:hypothetical protein